MIGFFQLFLQLQGFAVSNFGNPGQIAFAFGQLGLGVQLLLILFDFANRLNQVFFILPVTLHFHQLIVHIGQFGFQFPEAFFGGRICFLFQRLAFDFGLGDFALNFINFRRHAVNLNSQFGSTFVNQINGFIR